MCISVCGRYTQFEGAVWQLLCLRLKAYSRTEWRTKLNREGRLTMLKMTVRSCWHMVPGDEKDDRFQAQKKKNTVASLKTVQKKMCLEGSNLQDVQNEIELTILHSSGHACSMLPPPPKKEQNKTKQIYNQLSSWFYWSKVRKQLQSSKTRSSNFIKLWMGLQLLWPN